MHHPDALWEKGKVLHKKSADSFELTTYKSSLNEVCIALSTSGRRTMLKGMLKNCAMGGGQRDVQEVGGFLELTIYKASLSDASSVCIAFWSTESGPVGGLEADKEMLKKSADFFELTI
eukprot:gene13020-3528_t